MILRAATQNDAAATGAILSEFVATTPWMPKLHTSEQDRGFCQSMIAHNWVRVAEQNGVVAGFIARNQTEVNALYVGGQFRGQGLGAALLQDAQAAEEVLTLWSFQDNLGARRFYACHGFREIARTEGANNDEGLPDVQLRWQREA